MDRQTIFITGGRGYIGSALITHLKPKYRILYLTRDSSNHIPGATAIHGSLDDIHVWQEHLRGVDIIIHAAGLTHARTRTEYEKENAENTRNFLHVAQSMNVRRFIFISTRAIGKACGAYGDSKEHAETEIRKSKLDWEIARVGETYDDDWSSSEGINKFARMIARRTFIPIISDPSITLHPIHRDDVAACITAMVTTPHPKSTYTLAGPEALTFRQTAERIALHMKKHIVPLPIPPFIAYSAHAVSARLGKGYPDQWRRLVCTKDALSTNVANDLGIHPRAFLKD
jgi:NADH dehydrogenase